MSLVEFDHAILESEERVITSHAYVQARVESGAALPYDDIACDNLLAAELLYAEALSCAVAPVLTRSLSFFMSHFSKFSLVG